MNILFDYSPLIGVLIVKHFAVVAYRSNSFETTNSISLKLSISLNQRMPIWLKSYLCIIVHYVLKDRTTFILLSVLMIFFVSPWNLHFLGSTIIKLYSEDLEKVREHCPVRFWFENEVNNITKVWFAADRELLTSFFLLIPMHSARNQTRYLCLKFRFIYCS